MTSCGARLARSIAEVGGFTVRRDGQAVEAGIVVARTDSTSCSVKVCPGLAVTIERWLAKVSLASEDSVAFGGWHDDEDGVVRLEVVDVFDQSNARAAVNLAQRRHQRYVFHLERREVIPVQTDQQ